VLGRGEQEEKETQKFHFHHLLNLGSLRDGVPDVPQLLAELLCELLDPARARQRENRERTASGEAKSTHILKSIVSRLWAPEFFATRFTSKTTKIVSFFIAFHFQIALSHGFHIKILETSSLATLKRKILTPQTPFRN
jgi:hypothetical protein